MSQETSAVQRRVFLILLIGFAVVFLSSSIKTTYQVFFVDLAESFGQSRGGFAIAASVFMLTFGIASPLVGMLSDRIGPKHTISAGLVLSGIAFLGCANFDSYLAFVIFYGVVAAFGLTAVSYVPMGLLVDQAFSERRKGLAYATLTNGAAIGFMILSPAWVFMQPHVSWQSIYLVLGFVFLVPLFLVVQFNLPADPRPVRQGHADATPKPSFRQRVARVATCRSFLVLAFGFFGCGVTMAFVDVHMVAHLQELQLTPGQISLSLGLLGAAELIGGFVAGWMCDRFPKHFVIAGFYALRAVSLLVLLLMPTALGGALFGLLFGFSYLGTVIGTSMYTLGLFGKAEKGFAFGIIWLVHQVGAFASTQLGANAFDWSGSYDWTIAGVGFFAVVSAVVSVTLLKPQPQAVDAAESAELAKA